MEIFGMKDRLQRTIITLVVCRIAIIIFLSRIGISEANDRTLGDGYVAAVITVLVVFGVTRIPMRSQDITVRIVEIGEQGIPAS